MIVCNDIPLVFSCTRRSSYSRGLKAEEENTPLLGVDLSRSSIALNSRKIGKWSRCLQKRADREKPAIISVAGCGSFLRGVYRGDSGGLLTCPPTTRICPLFNIV